MQSPFSGLSNANKLPIELLLQLFGRTSACNRSYRLHCNYPPLYRCTLGNYPLLCCISQVKDVTIPLKDINKSCFVAALQHVRVYDSETGQFTAFTACNGHLLPGRFLLLCFLPNCPTSASKCLATVHLGKLCIIAK